jgi:glyoxylase-like metal-dependent hydrolase (beta-lactamase superfamily II)
MPAGSHRFQVGSISCTAVSDGYSSYPARWIFSNAEPEALDRALEARRLPHERVLSPYTCLLIETGRHVILVDAGAGESASTTGAVLARLEMEGIRPKDVDTVVFTHAHPEHIAGAVDSRTPIGRPVFPNARHLIAEAEIEFWMASRSLLRDLRLPDDLKDSMRSKARNCLNALRFKIEPVDGETEVVPGVTAIPAPGHTPGHLAIFISSGDQALLHLGDAALHPLHLEHPEWENDFDVAPDTAAATRRLLLERAAAGKIPVMAFHFPFPSVGRIAELPRGGWEWTPGC